MFGSVPYEMGPRFRVWDRRAFLSRLAGVRVTLDRNHHVQVSDMITMRLLNTGAFLPDYDILAGITGQPGSFHESQGGECHSAGIASNPELSSTQREASRTCWAQTRRDQSCNTLHLAK